MKDQLIPYHLAIQLKQLGFNETCIAAYFQPNQEEIKYPTTFQSNNSLKMGEKACTAPLWQQAFDWFREKKNFIVNINYSMATFDVFIDWHSHTILLDSFKDYQEARKEAVQKLIEMFQDAKYS